MNIRELQVRHIRVFQSDVIPLSLLATGAVAAGVSQRFGFADFNPTIHEGRLRSLEFHRGLLGDKGSDHVAAILNLAIEPRRIGITVSGEDEDALQAYEGLEDVIRELRPEIEDDLFEPILESRETTCICKLEIDLRHLLSGPFHDFTENWIRPRCDSDYGTAALRPTRIALRVDYETKSKLPETGALLANKEIIIEPRMDTQPEERLYYVRAPIPSTDFVSLLERFEDTFPAADRD